MTAAIQFQISLGFQNAHGIRGTFSHIVPVMVMIVGIGCAVLKKPHSIFEQQKLEILENFRKISQIFESIFINRFTEQREETK